MILIPISKLDPSSLDYKRTIDVVAGQLELEPILREVTTIAGREEKDANDREFELGKEVEELGKGVANWAIALNPRRRR